MKIHSGSISKTKIYDMVTTTLFYLDSHIVAAELGFAYPKVFPVTQFGWSATPYRCMQWCDED